MRNVKTLDPADPAPALGESRPECFTPDTDRCNTTETGDRHAARIYQIAEHKMGNIEDSTAKVSELLIFGTAHQRDNVAAAVVGTVAVINCQINVVLCVDLASNADLERLSVLTDSGDEGTVGQIGRQSSTDRLSVFHH